MLGDEEKDTTPKWSSVYLELTVEMLCENEKYTYRKQGWFINAYLCTFIEAHFHFPVVVWHLSLFFCVFMCLLCSIQILESDESYLYDN